MPPLEVNFPKSSSPGARPGEGAGALVNCFAELDGNRVAWVRSAGLTAFADSGVGTPRGFLSTSGTLYMGVAEALVSFDTSGVLTTYTGTLVGTGPITIARNNLSPTPDIAIVADSTAYYVNGGAVAAYPDADVGSPNSVCALDGYFIFTYGNGDIVASDLNSTAIDALSVASAESNPDGLLRGIVRGGIFYAMGSATIEPWRNAGTSPFPLERYPTVIPVGLFGQWAVAGYEDGWDGPIMFVATDGTVRSLTGFNAQRLVHRDVERDIAAIEVPSTLRAYVYTAGGHAFWVLSSPTWSWEYNLSTQEWNQRKSYLMDRWRAEFSAFFGGLWMVGDTIGTGVLFVDPSANDENGDPLIVRCEGVMREFPVSMRVPRLHFDFTVGVGSETGEDPIETEPKVAISVSHDGGASWSNPLWRELGRQGKHKRQVQVNNLGRSTPHGVRVAWECSDPVKVHFRGAMVPNLSVRRP
jgi:hypothetical protein